MTARSVAEVPDGSELVISIAGFSGLSIAERQRIRNAREPVPRQPGAAGRTKALDRLLHSSA